MKRILSVLLIAVMMLTSQAAADNIERDAKTVRHDYARSEAEYSDGFFGSLWEEITYFFYGYDTAYDSRWEDGSDDDYWDDSSDEGYWGDNDDSGFGDDYYDDSNWEDDDYSDGWEDDYSSEYGDDYGDD